MHKHSSNLYTVGIWDRKWLVPLEDTTKFESAYGAEIKPGELAEKHLLEVKGKLIYSASENAHNQISPTLIKDLSIKTGEPLPAPPPPPLASVIAPVPLPAPAPIPAPTPKISNGKLTMTLKLGYWGGQVKILQEFLKQQGYFPQAETTSRYFGPLTKNSLIEFQKANALEAVGTLGPKTRGLINSLLSQ